MRLLGLFLILGLFANTVLASKIYAPKGTDKHPAVIVLHSSAGITSHEKKYAHQLSRNGYVAVAVNYFTKGGTDNITAAYDALMEHPRVRTDTIGMVGFSKGAVQAMQFAYRSEKFSDRRISAIVSYYTFAIPFYRSENFPPILFLHGDEDGQLPPISVENYCDLSMENGYECEAVIYSGGKHAFDKKSSYNGYNPKLKTDAFNRTLEFFSNHLKSE